MRCAKTRLDFNIQRNHQQLIYYHATFALYCNKAKFHFVSFTRKGHIDEKIPKEEMHKANKCLLEMKTIHECQWLKSLGFLLFDRMGLSATYPKFISRLKQKPYQI